jgi:hypothetical protein
VTVMRPAVICSCSVWLTRPSLSIPLSLRPMVCLALSTAMYRMFWWACAR